MQEINVEEIMQEIREEIKAKGMEDQKLEFADVSMVESSLELPEKYDPDMMQKELLNLNNLWDTSLEEVRSKNPVKKAVKKVLQKAVGVIVRSHITEQTIFNASVVHSINMLNCLAKENVDLKMEVESLKEQVEQLSKKIG